MIFTGDFQEQIITSSISGGSPGRVRETRRPASHQQNAHGEGTPVLEGHRLNHSDRKDLFSSYIPRTMTPQEELHPVKEASFQPLIRPASLYDLSDPALRS